MSVEDRLVVAVERAAIIAAEIHALDAEAVILLDTPATFVGRGVWLCGGCGAPTPLGPRAFRPTVGELRHCGACAFGALG